ncbi:hypothetical protein [Microbacterium sp. NPDC057944]|uniref:hypothetical protein n=1 Tax=Microbacterium sp. NPDC057944 TaxID=3346286 RepID=UPI0036DF7EA3
MRKNIIIVAIIAIAAYVVGAETAKARGKDYEDIRHQLERLWTNPDARKSRARMAKKARRSIQDAQRKLQKAVR